MQKVVVNLLMIAQRVAKNMVAMAKLVDAPDCESGAEKRVSSSLIGHPMSGSA